MSNDLVLVRTPAPIIRHMVSLFPPTLLHCPHCSCPVLRLRSFCWLCDPCNKSQYNEVQSSCISSTKEMYNHIYYILRKICRGSDCQLQKCVPTITQQLLQSIIRGRIEKKSCQNFQLSQQSQKAMTGWMQRLHKSSQIRAGDVKSKLDSRRCNLQF